VRLNARILFAVAGLVASSAAAQTPGGWVHIQVEEPQRASRVHVNLPFAVVEAALKAAPDTVVSSGHIHLGLSSHDELSIADVRRIWEAVRNAGDADFVTVEHGEQNVKVARHGDLVEIHVEQPGQHQQADVTVPASLVDVLLAGDGETIDLKAALAELKKRQGDVVRVKDSDGNVRIWIDDKSSD